MKYEKSNFWVKFSYDWQKLNLFHSLNDNLTFFIQNKSINSQNLWLQINHITNRSFLTQGKPKGPQKPFQKLVRPRHTSVELGIRNKLFVGVLSKTRMLSPLASYLNQTLSAASNKATFFINNAEMSEKRLLETTPPGVKVVNFNDDRDHLLAFHSLKYVIDNYIDTYDWFFFVTDETFIRANKV